MADITVFIVAVVKVRSPMPDFESLFLVDLHAYKAAHIRFILEIESGGPGLVEGVAVAAPNDRTRHLLELYNSS
jgi:hypothetical protein